MGLLDFSDDEILKKAGIRDRGAKKMQHHQTEDENFEDLQLLGHKENSVDFSDSMFADRKEKDAKEPL